MVLNNFQKGSLTSTGAPVALQIDGGFDWFEYTNFTNQGSTANPGVVKKASFDAAMASGAGYVTKNTAGAATDESSVISSGGFTVYTGLYLQEAAVTGTAITAATPAVAAATSHGYNVGDTVLLTATTGMLQIAGMPFTITAVGDSSHFTLGYLAAAGFAAAATALTAKRIVTPLPYVPKARYITAITKASSAVVTFSVTHGYNVGDIIRLKVPAAFGMTQADGQQVTVTAISTANNTVTVNLDSTSFSTFAFPTSAVAAVGVSFAEATPVGEIASSLLAASHNTSFRGIYLGTTVCGVAADIINWRAWRQNA